MFERLKAFGRAIRDFFVGPAEPEKREPPREPPRQPPTGGGFDYSSDYEDRLHEVWEEVTGYGWPFGNGQLWLELWRDTGVELIEDDEDILVEWWEDFLRSHYLTSDEEGSISRRDYYDSVGLGRDRVDWEEFRDIKRGTP